MPFSLDFVLSKSCSFLNGNKSLMTGLLNCGDDDCDGGDVDTTTPRNVLVVLISMTAKTFWSIIMMIIMLVVHGSVLQ